MNKKLNPFYGLLPHSDVAPDNPLFVRGVRRVQWWGDERTVWRHSAWVFGFWLVIALLIGVSGSFFMGAFIVSSRGVPIVTENTVGNYYAFWDLLLMSSFLAAFILDFAVIGSTLARLVNNRSAVVGDLLHLTNLTGKTVATAYHTLARVASWRWVLVVIALRVMALMIYSFWLFIIFQMPTVPIFMAQFITLVVMGIEPLWRVRMITALAVGISTRFSNLYSAILGGFLIEAIVVVLPQYIFIQFIIISVFWNWSSNSAAIDYFILAFNAFVAFVAVYFAYFSLENVALNSAERYMFREGRD